MSNTIAKQSYNLLEVVFAAGDPTVTISRAIWRNGSPVTITGVLRTAAGVDYGSDISAIDDTVGAAALFIGREDTQQLLAVGVITHVDGVVGTLITTASRTVTFTVRSLEAGLHVDSLGTAGQTINFQDGSTTVGSFDAVAISTTNINSVTATTVNYSFPFYGNPSNAADLYKTIISAEDDPVISGRDPTFYTTAAGGTISINQRVQVNSTASLVIGAGLTGEQTPSFAEASADAPLLSNAGVLQLNLYLSSASDGSTIPRFTSLSFGSTNGGIAVYALTSDDSSATPAVKSRTWYILPGSEKWELDAGKFYDRGACILLYLGTAGADINYNLTASSPGGANDGLYIIMQ